MFLPPYPQKEFSLERGNKIFIPVGLKALTFLFILWVIIDHLSFLLKSQEGNFKSLTKGCSI